MISPVFILPFFYILSTIPEIFDVIQQLTVAVGNAISHLDFLIGLKGQLKPYFSKEVKFLMIFLHHRGNEVLFVISELLVGNFDVIALLLPFSTVPLDIRPHSLG